MKKIVHSMLWRTVLQNDRRIVRVFYGGVMSEFLSFVYPGRASSTGRATAITKTAGAKKAAGVKAARVEPTGRRGERLIPVEHEAILAEMYQKGRHFSAPGIEALIVDFAPSSSITPLPVGPQVRASYLLEREAYSRMHDISGESIEQLTKFLERISDLKDEKPDASPEPPAGDPERLNFASEVKFETRYFSASREPGYGQERYEYRGNAREVMYEWPDGFAITVAGHGSIIVVTYNNHPLDNLMLDISWHHRNYREMVPEITRLFKRGTFVSTPYMSGVAIDFTDAYVEPKYPDRDESKRFRGAYLSKNPNARHMYATYAPSFTELVRKMAAFEW